MIGSFRKFAPFAASMRNKVKMATNVVQNRLKSVNAANMAKGAKKGLLEGGISTKEQLRGKLLGVNVGVVDPNYRPLISGAGHTSKRLGTTVGKKIWNMTGRNYSGQILVGATAMSGLAIMKGMMGQANDIMLERYMRDARYSSRVMGKTGLGKASGNSALNLGNTVGLSLALSKTRHGH